MFHELQSRDRETGNPLAGLSGVQRARIRWPCLPAAGGLQGASIYGVSLVRHLFCKPFLVVNVSISLFRHKMGGSQICF